jgi:hypothetical protein
MTERMTDDPPLPMPPAGEPAVALSYSKAEAGRFQKSPRSIRYVPSSTVGSTDLRRHRWP